MPDTPFPAQFREARQRRNLTQIQVAEALGVSQSAVAQWESGRSFPSAPMVGKIEKLLGVRYRAVDQDRQPESRSVRRRRLPIIGLPAAGDEERILVDGAPHGEIAAPPQLEAIADAKAVYVRGRAMEPRYYPGEVVYLNPARQPNPGDFVFVTVQEPGWKFWRCVESGEPPRLFGVEPPRPRIEAARIVDMSSSNAWGEFAAIFARTRSAHLEHERSKTELKRLVPDDAQQAIGHGLRAKRSKSGAISFDLLNAEDGHAAVQ